jgi:hypothetical protein
MAHDRSRKEVLDDERIEMKRGKEVESRLQKIYNSVGAFE